jgi:pSer/pThr/pTyr-binding forkhead associated (FHA) protein
MKLPPAIIIQLVHILGPMKGEIQEFSEEAISIGRNPTCHLHFPANLTNISREHAHIKREGNRFKLIDRSSNGTFINGKRANEVYLKNGDVLEFSEGGPKVSFLTQVKEEHHISIGREPVEQEEPRKPGLVQPEFEEPEEISVQKVNAPLIIQYGPTIRSFREVPVTIGRNPKCDFILDHPSICDQQVQVFFSGNKYWVNDLTGQEAVRINLRPVVARAPLNINDKLSLSPQGPVFRFLGEGRLAEVQEEPVEEPLIPHSELKEVPQRDLTKVKTSKGLISRFKKYWES